MSVCRGGKNLLPQGERAGQTRRLTETQWRQRWEASRLFLTADGEKAKVWGNETIRWNPGESWLQIRLPTPLAHLANRPGGRYRGPARSRSPTGAATLPCQASTGAVRYDIWLLPHPGALVPRRVVEEAGGCARSRWRRPATAASWRWTCNAGHPRRRRGWTRMATRWSVPYTIGLPLAGLASGTRDGRLRAAITKHLLALAREHHAGAVVIEDLDFADARDQGRERTGRPACAGAPGPGFPASRSPASPPPVSVTGSPTWPTTPV